MLRIVFMGTPAFATTVLDAVRQAGYPILAVVTAPDKPAGRGHKLTSSHVKNYALEHHLPILQPSNLKDPEFVRSLQELQADVFIVVAFRMLPELVWQLPAKGTFNLHASLLPQYRGAAPIQHAILNGETETGVTTFLIDKEIDTGKILLQKKVPIAPNMTGGELHDALQLAGATLVLETLQKMSSGNLQSIPQENMLSRKELRPAPKIFKPDCRINWNNQVANVYNQIRALNPIPGAYTILFNISTHKTMLLKIYACTLEENKQSTPGQVVSDGKTYLKIGTQNGFIQVLEVQPEGRSKMPTNAFLRGIQIHDYTIQEDSIS